MNGQSVVRADIALPGGDVAAYGSDGLNYFAHADWLGSSRLQTRPDDGTLWWSNGVAPYGEGYSAGAVQYFTGQDADISFQNFDFPAREYSPIQGRWWTPDPAGLAAVDPNNPQTWNRYAYVAGDPLSALDPLGLMSRCIPSASLQKPGQSDAIATSFGPYSPNEDGTAAADPPGYDDCVGFGDPEFGWGFVDGADVPPGMWGPGGSFESEGGGAAGGGSGANCPTLSCTSIIDGEVAQFVPTQAGDYYQCITSGNQPTIQAAAVAAIDCASGMTQVWGKEFGGDVRSDGNGRYAFSVTMGQQTIVDLGMLEPGISLAIYHTHPANPGYDVERFSTGPPPSDTASSERYHAPIYLGTPSGRIEIYVPSRQVSSTFGPLKVLSSMCVLRGPAVGGPGYVVPKC